MLRIAGEIGHHVLTFRLEGSLTGQWVDVLEESWQRTLAVRRKLTRYVDLTGVTFVDAAGKACLAAMHRQGAEFIAADCMTKAIVDEITQEPLPRQQ
jgi:anti-anti-sigma regulatory factor